MDLACGWGPIDPDQEPNATGRDFGNWYPAQLTVTSSSWPPDDPGRFDLFVDGGSGWFENAQDGSSVTRDVPPGFYTVSEQAVPPTDPGQYPSMRVVQDPHGPGRGLRAGTVFTGVSLPGRQPGDVHVPEHPGRDRASRDRDRQERSGDRAGR